MPGKNPKNRSKLDRRRATLLSRTEAAARSRAQLDAVVVELTSVTVAQRDDEASLTAALERIAELKKSIKVAKKRRTKLRAARTDARNEHAAAGTRVEAADARYNRAVLADLVRREKARDLAAHAAKQPAPAVPAAHPADQPFRRW